MIEKGGTFTIGAEGHLASLRHV